MERKPDTERNFGFLVHDVARLLRLNFDRRSKALGLTRSQWWVLNNLYRNEGITQAELADILDIERPTLGRLLDRLEEKGWVQRLPDARDRRAKRVYLTGQVQDLMRHLRAIAAGLRADAVDGLDAAAQDRFVDTLLVIKTNLLKLESGERTEEPAAAAQGAADD